MTLLAQVKLRSSSGVPRDDVINTFHLDVVTSSAAARAAFTTAVDAAYDFISGYFSALIAQTGHEIRYYDLDDPEPRQPVGGVDTFDLSSAPDTDRLPGEVAIVVSTRANYVSGEPPARRRNRFYLGPLGQITVANTGLVDGTVLGNIADTFQTMFQSVNSSGDATAVVYSPTDGVSRDMVQLWVNNEFDTQRRRGRVETAREQRGI